MTGAAVLAPQPWMTAPATRRVLEALSAKGAEPRFVGGCVRDALLGREVKDIDIATPDPPERVIALLEAAGIRAIPTGVAHGTVTAIVDGASFEITTLRKDVETDGRHAKVAFTEDWEADAARRDLTINAISATPAGRLFDPFGGVADLEAGRIRFVGDARARIREDLLRLLRFFRFYAYYGKPPPDADALAACRELTPLLGRLSGERVAAETLKLLAAPEPASVVAMMEEAGVLRQFLPEAAASGIAALAALVRLEQDAAPDPLRRLAALLDPALGAAGAEAAASRLRLSGGERERLTGLIAATELPSGQMSERSRRVMLYRLGADRFRDLALLAWSREIAAEGRSSAGSAKAWRDQLAAAAAWRPVELPVKGRDLLALGLPADSEIGRLLAALEAWWIEEDFRPDRAACLARLEALAQAARKE